MEQGVTGFPPTDRGQISNAQWDLLTEMREPHMTRQLLAQAIQLQRHVSIAISPVGRASPWKSSMEKPQAQVMSCATTRRMRQQVQELGSVHGAPGPEDGHHAIKPQITTGLFRHHGTLDITNTMCTGFTGQRVEERVCDSKIFQF